MQQPACCNCIFFTVQHKQGSWNSAVEAVNKVSSCLYCMRLSFFPAVTRAVAVRNPYQAHTESGGAIVAFLIDGGHVFARGNLENFLKDFVVDIPRAHQRRRIGLRILRATCCLLLQGLGHVSEAQGS